ncbi:hypothetical protein [Cryptosporangium sp. NPDC051539]|uniref:hypothetical protein n=1 Tax=Cryptosporangium sp. NPDC051539 TaxID=3363962 RepID=UPI0037BC9512
MTIDPGLSEMHPGDPIRSSDWNTLASAVGGLQIGVTGAGYLGVSQFTSEIWERSTTSAAYVPAVKGTVAFAQKTTVLVAGHGHGLTRDKDVSLDIAIYVDGTLLGRRDNTSELAPWGAGVLQSNANSLSSWNQVLALGSTVVDAGSRAFEIRFRARGGGKEVLFSGASLWVVRLGPAA